MEWPAGERFQLHTHFGGEKIYVISGEFIDEYGRYPAGSWTSLVTSKNKHSSILMR